MKTSSSYPFKNKIFIEDEIPKTKKLNRKIYQGEKDIKENLNQLIEGKPLKTPLTKLGKEFKRIVNKNKSYFDALEKYDRTHKL